MINSFVDSNYIKLFIHYSLPVLIIALVSRTFPAFNFIYYLVIPLLFLYILLAVLLKLFRQINIKLALIILAFPVYCIITSIWSLYQLLSIQRSLYLIFLYTGILSAILLYKKYNSELSIKFFIPANIIIIILSLFSLITNIPANSWSGGNGLGFMGFAGHQNTLAAAILFTFPGVIYLVSSDQSIVISNKNNSFPFLTSHFLRLSSFILLLIVNLLLLILTYSRASWFALFIGLITFIILTKNIKIILSFLSLLIILSILTFSIPSVSKFMESLINKDDSPLFSRREILWKPSYEAAKLGGVIGLGYGVSAPDIKTPILTGSHFEDGRYVREKGNSVLAVVEETGLIGLFLFLLPVFWVIRKFTIYNSQLTIKEKPNNNYSPALPHGSRGRFLILNSTLAALLVHAQFEAWWVGVGSVQLPLFLIYLFLAILYKD